MHKRDEQSRWVNQSGLVQYAGDMAGFGSGCAGFRCSREDALGLGITEAQWRIFGNPHPMGIGRAMTKAGIQLVTTAAVPHWKDQYMSVAVAQHRLELLFATHAGLWENIVVFSHVGKDEAAEALRALFRDGQLLTKLVRCGWMCTGVQPIPPDEFAIRIGDASGEAETREWLLREPHGLPWWAY